MTKMKSRTKRWAETVDRAKAAYSEMEEAANKVAEALADLQGIQEEYVEWQDNLPENLQQSALGEKLEAICDIDIGSYVDGDEVMNGGSDLENVIGDAEGVELPLGFGRD